MLLEEKLAVTKQDTASKDTFFLINLLFLKQYMPENQSSKNKECHTGEGGGVRKVPKKCHVLFEWPQMLTWARRHLAL